VIWNLVQKNTIFVSGILPLDSASGKTVNQFVFLSRIRPSALFRFKIKSETTSP
jgi:hypothetical protein